MFSESRNVKAGGGGDTLQIHNFQWKFNTYTRLQTLSIRQEEENEAMLH